MSRRLLLLLLVAATALVLAPSGALAAGRTLTYDQAVDKLVADGYPQSIETYLNSLGTNPLGMRPAGTAADNAAASYLADQLRAAGLSNVRLEGVPVDAYDLKGADVTVGDRVMVASQFPGVRGTPAKGISGDVVYVGNGTAANFDAVGDVRGKIVLVDLALDYFWLNSPVAEATFRGATAVIMTTGPLSTTWYMVAPDALGSNDAECMDSHVPTVFVSTMDGGWLKQQLTAGVVAATVHSDVRVTPYTKGGTGYNVLAEIPGSARDGSKLLIVSHHDAHFRAGLDDTGAVATEMLMAKAMKTSAYKPQRTVVFLFTTGEEFGYGNSYFDYLTGSWYAITHTHTDWPGKVVGMMNLECLAVAGSPLSVNTSVDMASWLQAAIAANKSVLPWGASVGTPVSSWSDGYPLTASGVPAFTMAAAGSDFDLRYHTNYETQDAIDWLYVGKVARFGKVLAGQLDAGLLPYDLKARADDVAASVTSGDLQNAGVPAAKVTRLTSAVTAFRNAANSFAARKGSIPAKRYAAVNSGLLGVVKDIDANLSALSAWEEGVYPHEQVLYDVANLNKTLAALGGPRPQFDAALKALVEVGKTGYGIYFSPEVYAEDLSRLDPDYPLLTWGSLGHLPPELNVLAEYRMIERGDAQAAITGLTPVRNAEVIELGKRCDDISALLENLTPRVDALR